MKKEALTVMESQLANITVKETMAKELYQVNYLTSYPISDLMLEGWAKCILELRPDTTTSDIKTVIDKMKVGDLPFDNKKGIQNIFVGLNLTKQGGMVR